MKHLIGLIILFCFESVLYAQMNDETHKKQIISELKTIEDIELDLDIYNLGLIRKIEISPTGAVKIDMIFTRLFCPYGKQLINTIKTKVRAIRWVKDCTIRVDIHVRWKHDMMTEDGKQKMKNTFLW